MYGMTYANILNSKFYVQIDMSEYFTFMKFYVQNDKSEHFKQVKFVNP